MSTDVFGYRVKKREGKKLTVTVFNVYSDWRGFFPSPSNPTFFYGIVAEMNEDLQDRFEEESDAGWYEEDAMRKLGPQYIKYVSIVDIENAFADMEFTFYYERDGGWKDEEKLPQVTYEIELSDEALTENVSVGTGFGTTMYQADLLLLHNDNSDVPQIDRNDLSQLATLPWVGNLQSLVAAMDNLMFSDQDVVAYFNGRIGERNKLIDCLLQLTHDPHAARNGWDIEIVGLVNWFKLKKGSDEAMLNAMAAYGSENTSNLNYALRYLSISAGHHQPYITRGLDDLYTKTDDSETRMWLSYILFRNTGDKVYEEAFNKIVDDILESDDEDQYYELSKFCEEVWKYSSHADLLQVKPFIKKMSESKSEDLRRNATKLATAKELAL